MKKLLLIYYTGTYNTRYITSLVKDRFEKLDYQVDVYQIDIKNIERLDLSKYDLIGLGYPIYGFNAPYAFLKFIRKQKFPKGKQVFIYKNSGETYHANDASSVSVVNKIKRNKAIVTNEYHFIMPYNIHFRFDDLLIKEMLEKDEKLANILAYEVTHNINNKKRYHLVHKAITRVVRIQYIGGDVNSFFYKVDKNKCVKCGKCVKECPTQNIYFAKDGKVKFHHHCLMCMRCSFSCPQDAFKIGMLEGWHVNKPYDFESIKKLESDKPYITKDTKGFFKCYIETYDNIDKRYNELFSK